MKRSAPIRALHHLTANVVAAVYAAGYVHGGGLRGMARPADLDLAAVALAEQIVRNVAYLFEGHITIAKYSMAEALRPHLSDLPTPDPKADPR